MQSVCVLQHHPVEGLGTIARAFSASGLSWMITSPVLGEPVPSKIDDLDGLVVMGGPMAVYQAERFPFLNDEISLIRAVVRKGRPVLGVCLGAQIVAAALGAKVTRNPAGREIGWIPVALDDCACGDPLLRDISSPIVPFHWHADAFELPEHAVALASSEKTPRQAFRYGDNVYGLQFHLEVTADAVAAMAAQWPRDLERAGVSARDMIAESAARMPALEPIAAAVFGRWCEMVKRRAV
jgi:GMP synthase (glutamine-hydrolysing)